MDAPISFAADLLRGTVSSLSGRTFSFVVDVAESIVDSFFSIAAPSGH